ncbi:hypothetical protein BDR04DRAFT_1101178 [Suillus decipiens]|nr:hypothetical protein BDR04DRAFT_1101178 [Suillus decipiens]
MGYCPTISSLAVVGELTVTKNKRLAQSRRYQDGTPDNCVTHVIHCGWTIIFIGGFVLALLGTDIFVINQRTEDGPEDSRSDMSSLIFLTQV